MNVEELREVDPEAMTKMHAEEFRANGLNPKEEAVKALQEK